MDHNGRLAVWLAASLALYAACGDHGNMVAKERAHGGSGSATASAGAGGTLASGGASVGGSAGQTNGDSGVFPGCQYRVVPGIATITSIAAATAADGSLCPGGSMSVRYEFVADDASLSPDSYDVARYNFNSVMYHQLRLPVGSAASLLPLGCVEKLGIVVGAKFADNRSLATAGSCTPAYDTFPTLDLASCYSLCQ